MNQRRGKTYKSASSFVASDTQARGLHTFFKMARQLLELDGREDAAFYFEQIETTLGEGKPLPVTEVEVRRALGL